MPTLDDFFPAPENNAEGTFDCQHCDETVHGAYLDMTKMTLEWKCSKGHVSKVEL